MSQNDGKLLPMNHFNRGASACLFGLVFLLLSPALQGQLSAAPPAMKHPLVPSHGSDLLGVFYLAAGSEPHPTAILFHGFPGFEQNLDLAQALRRDGWNVLAMHYRGSWGVRGTFSFLNAVEDADAEVRFVMNPTNVAKYHIDVKRVVTIGHSMGGFMATAAAAHNPAVAAIVLISAWNIGAFDRSSEAEEANALGSGENLAPIAGSSGAALAHEEFTHRSELDMLHLVPSVARHPFLVITANDGSGQFADPFVAALTAAGDHQISPIHFDTDHAFSGQRLELESAVIKFLDSASRK